MNWIAKIGSDPRFITFMAHFWFAYATVHTFPSKVTVMLLVVLFGTKEFFFDKHYEANQHFFDNLYDFIGYVSGVLAGCMATGLIHV